MTDDATPAPRPGFGLKTMQALSARWRTLVVNLGFFSILILLLPSVASQFSRREVVIEPIAVPSALAKQGFYPEVVANRLWDGLQELSQQASAARETIATIPDSEQPSFSLPDAAISVDSIFRQIRQFLQIYEPHVSGELVCGTPDCARESLRLRLRVTGAGAKMVDLGPIGDRSEHEYFREAAVGVYAVLDPYVAIAAMAESEPLRATVLARRMIREEDRDARWAHNLIGSILMRAGDPVAAETEYRAALALDPNFAEAHTSLGFALVALDRLDEAEAAFNTARRFAPRGIDNDIGFARVAEARNDPDGALKAYLEAAERDPLNPAPLVAAGRVEAKRNANAEAEARYREALEIDPGDPDALAALAELLDAMGRADEAEAVRRQMADTSLNPKLSP